MGRLNRRLRDQLWDRVAYREVILGLPASDISCLGEHCRGCGKRVTKHRGSQLPVGYIDCIDNSGDHTDIRNLQLLCPSCNRLKNPKRPSTPPSHQMTSSEHKNMITEHRYRKYVISAVADGPKSRFDLNSAACEAVKASTTSGERYMDKLVSWEGILKQESGHVMLKTEEELPDRLKDLYDD